MIRVGGVTSPALLSRRLSLISTASPLSLSSLACDTPLKWVSYRLKTSLLCTSLPSKTRLLLHMQRNVFLILRMSLPLICSTSLTLQSPSFPKSEHFFCQSPSHRPKCRPDKRALLHYLRGHLPTIRHISSSFCSAS